MNLGAERPELVEVLLKHGADSNIKSLRNNQYTSGNYDKIDPATGEKLTVSDAGILEHVSDS